jgi:hypothetical protein
LKGQKKKKKKQVEPSQDNIISPKTKNGKKKNFFLKVVSPKTKTIIKSEGPSEENEERFLKKTNKLQREAQTKEWILSF